MPASGGVLSDLLNQAPASWTLTTYPMEKCSDPANAFLDFERITHLNFSRRLRTLTLPRFDLLGIRGNAGKP
jgi:hypothetical protein